MNGEQSDFPDAVEQHLRSLTPRPAPAELRQSVLAAVYGELAATQRPRWERRIALAAAVLLVASAVLNIVIIRSGERRLARILGPDAMPQGIVQCGEIIEVVTDDKTARSIQRQLLAMSRANSAPATRNEQMLQVQLRLNEWALHGGDWLNEKTLEDSETDRHRSDGRYRGAFKYGRDRQLASERTA
ncbi:MAG: hypothetical protein O3C40_02005 [Planctomycetota bacterium]|nr:hypothetical protein [Planctomycetota bacterium]